MGSGLAIALIVIGVTLPLLKRMTGPDSALRIGDAVRLVRRIPPAARPLAGQVSAAPHGRAFGPITRERHGRAPVAADHPAGHDENVVNAAKAPSAPGAAR
jgi:hypothetical protein